MLSEREYAIAWDLRLTSWMNAIYYRHTIGIRSAVECAARMASSVAFMAIVVLLSRAAWTELPWLAAALSAFAASVSAEVVCRRSVDGMRRLLLRYEGHAEAFEAIRDRWRCADWASERCLEEQREFAETEAIEARVHPVPVRRRLDWAHREVLKAIGNQG